MHKESETSIYDEYFVCLLVGMRDTFASRAHCQTTIDHQCMMNGCMHLNGTAIKKLVD